MYLIHVFGALLITSGFFCQVTAGLQPEVRGKFYLFRNTLFFFPHAHAPLHTYSLTVHTQTHTLLDLFKPVSFLLTSLNRPVCSSGFICEDTMH